MITVSWYPGNLKGATVKQTQDAIIRGLQLWQGRCGVRFGTLPAGNRTQITIYPYSGAMPGIMAAYQQTGQILYTTTHKIPLERCPMFFAHEVGHCFGWGHSNPDKPEKMMHWRGSTVDYMDAVEGRRAIAQFGRSANPDHPWSLKLIGDEIRKHEPSYAKSVQKLKDASESWKRRNKEWKRYRGLRDSETDPEQRKKYNERVQHWLKKRDEAGIARAFWHEEVKSQKKILMPLWQRWSRINREWSQVSAASIKEELVGDKPCTCFEQYNEGPQPMTYRPLKDVFAELRQWPTVPLKVN